MNQIILKARAKINLTLDVLGKREDGYHDIKMIMQTVNLYDNIYIKKIKGNEIKLSTNLKWLPTDNKNLAYRAADLIRKKYSINEGIFIEIKKRIPVAAGLAGGSSDAAAVLIGMRTLFQLKVSIKELITIGKELGADVPYCIMRGTALAEGIGDILTRLPKCPDFYVILAKPPISVSTQSIYKSLDNEVIQKRPDTDAVIEAIKLGDKNKIASNLYNVMEIVTTKKYPVIKDFKNFLLQKGALGVVMSGSGPTVFGLFDDKEIARQAYYRLKVDKNIKDAFLTTIF